MPKKWGVFMNNGLNDTTDPITAFTSFAKKSVGLTLPPAPSFNGKFQKITLKGDSTAGYCFDPFTGIGYAIKCGKTINFKPSIPATPAKTTVIEVQPDIETIAPPVATGIEQQPLSEEEKALKADLSSSITVLDSITGTGTPADEPAIPPTVDNPDTIGTDNDHEPDYDPEYDEFLLSQFDSEQDNKGTKDYKKKLLAHVERFNKNHAQVLIGGKHRIMRTVPAKANHDNRESYEFLPQEALVRIYQNTAIQTGLTNSDNPKPIYKDHLTAWAKHFNSRVYTGGVVFKPPSDVINNPEGDVPKTYFNTWQGYAVKPKNPDRNLLARIHWHIEHIICGDDKEQYDYFYNWVAYTLQHPDRPAGAALVLRGGKGSGKGTIGHFLMKLWGIHALHISNSKHLTSNFNGHLIDVCFLFLDEAYFSGDKQGEGVLKALVTEIVMTIERKGIDAVQQPNYLKVFMATNNEWAVPADKDERRYCVFDVSIEKAKDRNYFNDLNTDTHNKDVQSAFLYEMLHRDISNFHTGDIPDTEGLRAQIMASLPSEGKWLIDSLNAGYFEQPIKYTDGQYDENASTEWINIISAKKLETSYLLWCDNQRAGEYNRANQTELGNYLTKIGFDKKKSNGVNRVMGMLEDAIIKFESYHKVKIATVPKK
jgi:hypothetical protein